VQNRLLRETLVKLFQKRPDIDMACEVADAQALNGRASAARCDVLLLDSLANLSSSEAIPEVRDVDGEKKIVLFGMDEDEESFLKAVRLGVSGYLLKDASSTEIIAAVRGVAEGKAICPPKLCMTLFRHVARQAESSEEGDSNGISRVGLTFRQRELIALVAKGLTNKEIAARLNLSEFTVKNHIHRIMRNVEAASRQDAVDVVRAKGILPQA
jgi:two-component system response regulator DegU